MYFAFKIISELKNKQFKNGTEFSQLIICLAEFKLQLKVLHFMLHWQGLNWFKENQYLDHYKKLKVKLSTVAQ